MLDHDIDGAADRATVPVELWEVNEQLLLGRLREQARTDQLQLQFQLQLAFSRAIAGGLAEGVCAIDQAGTITFVNLAGERMVGWREAELRAQNAETLLYGPGATRSEGTSPLLDVLHSGTTSRTDQGVFVRKDGTTFPVAYSVAPLVVNTQVVGVIVAFDDLTEQQRVSQLQEEYLVLLSHDLRTPLQVILGHAQLLQGQLQATRLEPATQDAEAIVTSAGTMNRLIQSMLDRNRLPTGATELHLATVDLIELVTRIVDQNLLPVDAARVELETVAQLPVVADPLQLERVIVNLLSNACKYSPPTAQVTVRVFRNGDDAMISFTDQGVGIGIEDVPHLFEKYFRARTAGTVAGSGLGLYGSRLIAEAHGGRISVQSIVGSGSTFTVSLPIRASAHSSKE